MKQYRCPQTSALLTVSSLLLGFLFRPFSWLIFSTHLTAATLSSVARKHICTVLKDDSCCHLRPNRSVEAEWIGAVTPFPKALMIHEKILKVCKCNFCCCRFCLVVFLRFWFFVLHLGFAIMVTHEQRRTTMLGNSILAFLHPLLVTVTSQKVHLHTHTGGPGDPQYPSQRQEHLPGLSKRSFGFIEWHPHYGQQLSGLLVDWRGSLHGNAWEEHLWIVQGLLRGGEGGNQRQGKESISNN